MFLISLTLRALIIFLRTEQYFSGQQQKKENIRSFQILHLHFWCPFFFCLHRFKSSVIRPRNFGLVRQKELAWRRSQWLHTFVCILRQARQNFYLLIFIPGVEFQTNFVLITGEPKITCSDSLFYFKRWLSHIYFEVILFYPWDKRLTKFKGSNSGFIDFSGLFSSVFTGSLWHTEKITLKHLLYKSDSVRDTK